MVSIFLYAKLSARVVLKEQDHECDVITVHIKFMKVCQERQRANILPVGSQANLVYEICTTQLFLP